MGAKISLVLTKLALALSLMPGVSSAATIGNEEKGRLLAKARNDGAVPVVVHLAAVSLDRLKNNGATTKAEMANLSSRLLTELGAEALEGGRWDAGMGQKWGHPSAWNKSDGRFDEIDRRLGRDGYVEVDVLWNVDGLVYDIGIGNRPSYKMTSAQSEEARTKVKGVIERAATRHIQNRTEALANVQSSSATPETRLRLNREGLQKLLDNPEVRSVAPVNFVDARPRYFDQDAHKQAAERGSAEIIIALRDPMLGGILSKNSDNERKNANQRVLEDILKNHGFVVQGQFMPALGVVVVRASVAQLHTLAASNDARVASVMANKPVAQASTVTSVPSLNIPQAWSKGYSANGQY